MRKAEEVRIQEHRLKPGLRLRTREEINKFIHDRGLVSVLGGNELPGLISAVLGKPWKPSRRGFSGWLDWWSVKISGQRIALELRNIEGRDDVLSSRFFRRTKTFVSNKVWPTIDPVVKHHRELARKGELLSTLENRVLETIETEDAVRTDRLRAKLGLESKENNYRFHKALSNLESYMLIIGAEDPAPEKHLHANIWQTWDKRTGKKTRGNLDYRDVLAQLYEKTFDACILAREDRLSGWFQWNVDVKPIIQELLHDKTILRAGSYLVSSRVSDINT